MKKRWKALAGVIAICLVLSIMSNATAQDANAVKDPPKEPNNAAPQETPKEPNKAAPQETPTEPNKASPQGTPKEEPTEKSTGNQGDSHLVIGVVNVVKDSNDNITDMTITAHRDLVYKVFIDAKSKEMASSFADKRARVEGVIETKGDVKWLTVQTFGESKPKAAGKPGAKGKAKPAAKPAPKSRK